MQLCRRVYGITRYGAQVNRGVALLAAGVGAVLVAFATGYGYHRDELYFLAAGRHLDWSYADQGPLTPLIARATSEIAPGSLTVLRLPSALAIAGILLLTGALAREFGGSRRAALIAVACTAASGFVLFTGHVLSTSTFDLLVWTAVCWLVVRAVRTGADRLWLVTGAVLGIGLLNKPLPAFLALALVAGVAIAGPRRPLTSRHVWAGAVLAAGLWSPWLVWQARHGWPQIDVSRSIAAGGSTSSAPWWSIVPNQALLFSPPLAPVWIAGLVRLFRGREFRFLAWAWLLLAVVFMATGGKPYYLGGLGPALLAAGSVATDGWLERGRVRARRAVLTVAVAGSAIVSALVALPILPAGDTGPVIALNGDVAETIGWPAFARTIDGVRRREPGAVILTGNYGEAGAIERYGSARAYSGHNAFWDWGPPPDDSAPVIAVGLSRSAMASLRGCSVAARIDDGVGVDNEEQGKRVYVCAGPRRPWNAEWPALRHLG